MAVLGARGVVKVMQSQACVEEGMGEEAVLPID